MKRKMLEENAAEEISHLSTIRSSKICTAVILDSCVSLPKEKIEPFVTIVSQIIQVGLDTVIDFVGSKTEDYDPYLNTSLRLTTSRPNPTNFYSSIKEVATAGYKQCLLLTLTTKTSGTYDSAIMARTMAINDGLFMENDIAVVDSSQVALGHGILAIEAMRYVTEGNSLSSIVERLIELKQRLCSFYLIDNIIPMYEGGRIHSKIHPSTTIKSWYIVKITYGELHVLERALTKEKCFLALTDIIKNGNLSHPNLPIIINYIGLDAMANRLQKLIQRDYPNANIISNPLCLDLAVHFKPTSLGVSWCEE